MLPSSTVRLERECHVFREGFLGEGLRAYSAHGAVDLVEGGEPVLQRGGFVPDDRVCSVESGAVVVGVADDGHGLQAVECGHGLGPVVAESVTPSSSTASHDAKSPHGGLRATLVRLEGTRQPPNHRGQDMTARERILLTAIEEAVETLKSGEYDDGDHPLVDSVINSLTDTLLDERTEAP